MRFIQKVYLASSVPSDSKVLVCRVWDALTSIIEKSIDKLSFKLFPLSVVEQRLYPEQHAHEV